MCGPVVESVASSDMCGSVFESVASSDMPASVFLTSLRSIHLLCHRAERVLAEISPDYMHRVRLWAFGDKQPGMIDLPAHRCS